MNDNIDNKNLRLIQITDTHLCAETNVLMVGVNVEESFTDVVDLVRQQESNVDAYLCTGDLSQDASQTAYKRFASVMDSLGAPHLWLPGNHDNVNNIQQAVGEDSTCLRKVYCMGNWQIVMLDSSIINKTHGHLSENELLMLDSALKDSAKAGQFSLVCVHHNPVPVNAEWLQNVCLRNSDDLFKVLDRYSHVKGVLFGHIHQDIEVERNNVKMLGSPSTCIQFHPDNNYFTLDDINPGYRWLELSAKGDIETGVERVKGKHYNVDFSSAGY